MGIQQPMKSADTATNIERVIVPNAAQMRSAAEIRSLAERMGVLAVRQALEELETVDA